MEKMGKVKGKVSFVDSAQHVEEEKRPVRQKTTPVRPKAKPVRPKATPVYSPGQRRDRLSVTIDRDVINQVNDWLASDANTEHMNRSRLVERALLAYMDSQH